MSTQAAPPAPPTTLSKDGDDWDDNRMLHYCQYKPDGTRENVALCGFESESGYIMSDPTEQQLDTLPFCPICIAVAKYDGRWKLPE